jgi:beta-glucosidase
MVEGDDAVLRERLGALGLEQKVRLLTGADFWALHDEPAAGLRRLVTSDGPAGVRGERWDERDTAANVPSPTALAATWDVERIERLGRLLAAECRRKGVDVLLAPTVNLHRSPYGGRHFECFSEDPLLTARIGTAYVRGLQGAGVGATVKHVVANDSETERFTLDARIDERTLRELYLAPFEAIVRDAAPWALMAAYNGVNGHTMTEHPLLREIVKDEWGFDGVVMSDWFATRSAEAAGRAALDLAMPGPTSPWGDALVAAVRAGQVEVAAIDDKVLRLLRLAGRVGALAGVAPATAPAAAWSDAEVTSELRATAAAGIVLARNEDALLPLDRGGLRRVAVLGPNAAVARTLGGGSATVYPTHTVSPLDGLRAALDGVEVTHAAGVTASERTPPFSRELLGRAGARVRFLGADGSELGSERRFGGAFAWMGAFADGVAVDRVAAIEVRATLHASEPGEYVVGCSGAGRFSLALGGEPPEDVDLTLPPDVDIALAHMHPPQHERRVRLEAGGTLGVVLRRAVDDPSVVTFQLNAGLPHEPDDEGLARAEALARDADVAVVVVGTTEEVESEGFDRESLALPGRQDELVRRVAAANPRTVVVVNAGAPVLLPWAEDVPAILLAWFGGQEMGDALADVLLGAVEPGGRLPTIWPMSEEGLPSTRPVDGVLEYREGLGIGHRGAVAARFAFGHGLGFTDWEYLELTIDGACARVRLRNAGPRRGREVVQLYASRPDSAVARPARWLAGFTTVEVEPGEAVEIGVELGPRALEHWDTAAGAFVVEPGTFVLAAGRSSADLRLTARLATG